MNRQAIFTAITAFLVTLCTALITAFNQDGVVSLGDVHPATYAAAVLGAVVAAVHAFQARNKPSTAKANSTLLSLITALALIGLLFAPDPAVAATTQTAKLSWTAPTTRVDGTALASGDIAAYNVYYSVGAKPDKSSTSLKETSGTTATVTLNLNPSPSAQTIYFAVTAVDTNGNESALSNIASKSFLVKSTALPEAPTSVTFSVSCGAGCSISSQ